MSDVGLAGVDTSGVTLLSQGEFCSGGSCPGYDVVLLSSGVTALDTQGYGVQDLPNMAYVPLDMMVACAEDLARLGLVAAQAQDASVLGGRIFETRSGGLLVAGQPVTHQYRNVPKGETVVRTDPAAAQRFAARAGKLAKSREVANRSLGIGI